MEKLRKRYNKKSIEDEGGYMSREAKSFVTCFRNALKREFPEATVNIRSGHYDLSGFIGINDKIIYIMYSIPRYEAPFDFDDTSCMNGVCYRTAKDYKDYKGGPNHFCSLSQLTDRLSFFFENGVCA